MVCLQKRASVQVWIKKIWPDLFSNRQAVLGNPCNSSSKRSEIVLLCEEATYHFTRILPEDRDVTRLNGSRGKKQFGAPHVRIWGLTEEIYCIEESVRDNVGTFRRLPQWFGAWGIVPPLPPSLRPCSKNLSDGKQPNNDQWWTHAPPV